MRPGGGKGPKGAQIRQKSVYSQAADRFFWSLTSESEIFLGF
jgi:hypothetical protein